MATRPDIGAKEYGYSSTPGPNSLSPPSGLKIIVK